MNTTIHSPVIDTLNRTGIVDPIEAYSKYSKPVVSKNLYSGLKVLGLAADDSACGNYRIIIPFWYLNKYGANCQWTQVSSLDQMMEYDIIIAQRQYDKNIVDYMLYELMRYNKIVIYEIDDNLHAVLPSSPVFGIYHQGSDALKKVSEVLYNVHGITVSTPELAGDYSNFNHNVEILPNSIDFEIRDWETLPDDKDPDTTVVGWAGGTCFLPDTEVLTDSGFKLFVDLDGNEKIATLNKETGVIEYQTPTEWVNVEYSGPIHLVNKFDVNYGVTPNHWMYVQINGDTEYRLIQSEDLQREMLKFSILRTGGWEGEYKEISPVKYVTTEEWVEFLGCWFACGSLEKSFLKPAARIVGPNIEKYISGFREVRVVSSGPDRVEALVFDKDVCKYLSKIKKKDNAIPREVLELPSIYIEKFLNAFLESPQKSGMSRPKRVYVSGKKIADDLLEAALKSGTCAAVTDVIDDDIYIISFGDYLSNFELSGEDIEEVNYTGTVHCVTVPNHIIYVKRNGKCMWAGNTHWEDLQILSSVIPPILDRYKNVKFGVYSSQQMMSLLVDKWGIDPDRVLFIPPRPFSDYPTGLPYFDIGLAPTINCRFNAAKSNLKILEYGAWKIPCVASKVPPYVTTIKNYYNGFTANTPLEWYTAICYLIENKEERTRMGETIYKKVTEEFNMDKNIHLWPQAWKNIIENRDNKGSGRKFPILWGNVRRNDKCPCGSGIKYKKCECYPAFGG